MSRFERGILLLALVCLGYPTAGTAAEPISADEFPRLFKLIKPAAGEEKWQKIPWLSSLWEARKKAAAEGKPILLWEMDGNPLGCV